MAKAHDRWLRRVGRWIFTWPHSQRAALILAAMVWTAGLVAGRLDGLALMDLPYGPVLADGVPSTSAADVRSRKAVETERPISPQQRQSPKTLVVATEGEYPPFNFVDATGALRGLEVDLTYAVCAELQVTCEIVAREWDQLQPGLLTGDYQVVAASLRIPDEPTQDILFSTPYFRSSAAYATRKGNMDARASGPIGVEADTRMAAYLMSRGAAEVRTYPDAVATYQALSDGEVAAIFDEAVRLNRWLNDPSSRCCEMAGGLVYASTYFGNGVGFAVRAGDVELVERLNGALAKLANEGRIAELSDRYLPFALN
ncbi:MAG: transporter substrate-binding domain-containing protein [Candidatus Phaeomarinobacter sp.]